MRQNRRTIRTIGPGQPVDMDSMDAMAATANAGQADQGLRNLQQSFLDSESVSVFLGLFAALGSHRHSMHPWDHEYRTEGATQREPFTTNPGAVMMNTNTA
ncbi:hypothetical protein GCM10022206_19360 [Streptomyces chiangmaiensis]